MANPTVLVSGVGLMGGSLAAALTRAGWPVLLHHRRPEVARRAAALGYGRAVDDLTGARCDLAVVCTPVGAIAPEVRRLTAALPDAVITDVGSVKGCVHAELADLVRAGRFLGSHPLAGSHQQGLDHARANLFDGCLTVVTPVGETPPAAIALVERMWQAVGCRVSRMSPEDHDDAVAKTSHLPHVMSGVVAANLDDRSAPLAATGFRDTTRIAASDPALWADILINNRDSVLNELMETDKRMKQLMDDLQRGDAAAVKAWLERARDGRLRFERQSPPTGDGGE
jgi:prephenate dehydrogenase